MGVFICGDICILTPLLKIMNKKNHAIETKRLDLTNYADNSGLIKNI